MARTPNSRKQDTHERIVDVAAQAIREHGYAGLGVADVMKQAGLTHGGFYAHFDSREALICEALDRAGRQSADHLRRATEAQAHAGVGAFAALVEAYLADGHLATMASGCPVAALGSDMPRQAPAVREASARRVRRLVAGVAATLPGADATQPALIAATLVGTLQLARALGDSAEGRALLATARRALVAQYGSLQAAGPADATALHD